MTIFNVKAESNGRFESSVIDKNHVDIKTRNNISMYGSKNFSPVLDNAIADQHVAVTNTKDIDISNVFSDIDTGVNVNRFDSVTIVATSSDVSVCSPSVIGDTLKLYGHTTGQVTITLTATDLFGESISDTFTVDVFVIVWLGLDKALGPFGEFWVYELDSSTGDILSSFEVGDIISPVMRGIASIDFDKSDNTIFFNDNQSTNGERLIHSELDGTLISEVATTPFSISNPDGIAIGQDDTLWLVSGADNKVYNVSQDFATLFSSFSFGTTIAGLAFEDDGTLWITDNTPDKVYNLTQEGVEVSSFPYSNISGTTTSVQCVGASRWDNTLWLVDNDRKLYNMSKQGVLLNTPIDLLSIIASLSTVSGLSLAS